MDRFASATLRVFGWLSLVLGTLLALAIFLGPQLLLSQLTNQNSPFFNFGTIGVTAAATIVPAVAVFLSGTFVWALLMCIATITDCLLDLRDRPGPQRRS